MVDSSELLMVLGAIIIFSVAVVNVNRGIARNELLMVEADLEYTAVAIGQNLVDEARVKAFDEVSVSSAPSQVPAGFTGTNKFGGANDGETYPLFDDFDDYHNFTRTDTTVHGIYTTNATVTYVTENDPEHSAGGKTAFKRLTVVVTSPFLSNSVTLSYVKPY
ncbi:MAG TPA: hypothetical protein VKA68_01505 [bacterium]|nr:hypothetical protein [bacterium]